MQWCLEQKFEELYYQPWPLSGQAPAHGLLPTPHFSSRCLLGSWLIHAHLRWAQGGAVLDQTSLPSCLAGSGMTSRRSMG